MATTLPIRKIYIDSRWCTPDSVSSSNFKVQVPRTMQMPDNTVFFVNDVCIPHTWTTIETGFNDKLYVLLLQTPAGVYSNHLLTLLAQNYTVPTFIQELQRAFATLPGDFSVTPDVNNGARIAVTDSSVKFKILTDDDVTTQRYWFEGRIDPNEINSANDNINNTVSSDTLIDISGYYSTGFMRLNWLNNIYITSPNLGSFDTIFAGRGDNNIIKKVPVMVNYGFMVIDQMMSTNDFLDCSKQTIQTLEFHLKTASGKYVPLHGAHVSFSLVFNRFETNG